MAITSVSWAAGVIGTTGTLSPAQPSPAAGDLLLCFAWDYAQLTSWTQPSGWSTLLNQVSASGSMAVFYKKALGTEGTGTVTVTATGTGNSRLARICKVIGAGAEAAYFTSGADEAETATPYVNAGVTPPTANNIVFFVGGVRDCITPRETDGFSTPTGGTNLGTWTMNSDGTTGGSDAALGIAYALQTTAAATGNISCVLQASQASYVGRTFTFAVKPAFYDNVTEALTLAASLAHVRTTSNNVTEALTLGDSLAASLAGDIVRDATAHSTNVPILAGAITGPVTTVDTATFDVSANATLIVVRVGCSNWLGTVCGAATCVWIGGTPANASDFTEQVTNVNTGGYHRTAIFTATVTGALTGVSIRAGSTNSIPDASSPVVSVAVDALVNASTTMGSTNSEQHDGGAQQDHSITVATVDATSWVFAVAAAEDDVQITFAPISGTTEENERLHAVEDVGVAMGLNNAYDSPASVGWSTLTTYGSTCALEIEKTSTGPKTYNQTVTEALTLAATYAHSAVFPNTLSEALALAATLLPGLRQDEALTEALALAESYAQSATFPNALTEALTLNDVLAQNAVLGEALTEALSLSATYAQALVASESVTESITLAASYAHALIAVEVLSEALALVATYVDDLVHAGGTTYNDSFTEALALNDALTPEQIHAEALTAALTLADLLVDARVTADAITEALTLTDVLGVEKVSALAITEALTLVATYVDTFIPTPRTYNESLTEALGGGGNGLNFKVWNGSSWI